MAWGAACNGAKVGLWARAARAVDTVRVRNLFKRVTVRLHAYKPENEPAVPVMEHILRHYTLWVGDQRVPLSQ